MRRTVEIIVFDIMWHLNGCVNGENISNCKNKSYDNIKDFWCIYIWDRFLDMTSLYFVLKMICLWQKTSQKFLLNRSPFCGTVITLCFGLWVILRIGFKGRVDPSLPELFSGLQVMTPDWQSHLWLGLGVNPGPFNWWN